MDTSPAGSSATAIALGDVRIHSGRSGRAARARVRLALPLAELGPEAGLRRVGSSGDLVDRLPRSVARAKEPAPCEPDTANESTEQTSRGHLTRPRRRWRRRRCGRRSARRAPRSRSSHRAPHDVSYAWATLLPESASSTHVDGGSPYSRRVARLRRAQEDCTRGSAEAQRHFAPTAPSLTLQATDGRVLSVCARSFSHM